MRELFERLKNEGHSAVEEIVSSRLQETVQLDFKVKSNPNNGELNREDRAVLGPLLSAFANSAGGLLIWGIEARPDADKIDAAQRAVPIPNLARFKSDVWRAIGDLLTPRHDGIEAYTIEDPQAPDAGYLAIWVERSDRRPHRSEAANDKRYYKRAGESTYVMEHYDVEDAFNRIAPVDLQLVHEKAVKGEEKRERNYLRVSFTMPFALRNLSRLSACAPYVWIDQVVGAAVQYMPWEHLKRRGEGGRAIISGDATTFVHPGFDVPIFSLQIVVGYYLGSDRWDHGGTPLYDSKVVLNAGVGCQNARAKAVDFQWAGAALADLLSV